MKYTIIENDKPDLPVCKMMCDGGLAEHLNDYEITKFMNCHSVNLFIGKPGSGKTSLLYSFFKGRKKGKKIFRKVFTKIYLFMPSHSRGSLKDNIFENLPDEQKFDELTQESLEQVLNDIKYADPDDKHCIIFDDCTAALKDSQLLRAFKELVYNRRHLHVSIFFLVQSWISVPKDVRKLFTNIFCFKVSKSEMDNLFNEVIEQKRDHLLDIMKIVYDAPHQWMFINTMTGDIYKCWDKILIDDP